MKVTKLLGIIAVVGLMSLMSTAAFAEKDTGRKVGPDSLPVYEDEKGEFYVKVNNEKMSEQEYLDHLQTGQGKNANQCEMGTTVSKKKTKHNAVKTEGEGEETEENAKGAK